MSIFGRGRGWEEGAGSWKALRRLGNGGDAEFGNFARVRVRLRAFEVCTLCGLKEGQTGGEFFNLRV